MHRSFVAGLLALAAGCSSPRAQLSSIQEDKEQLLATIKGQRETIRALRAEDASKEARLAEAEKELARAGGGTRLSARPADSPPVKTESLPWRLPPAKSTPVKEKTGSTGRSSLPALAARDQRLHVDQQ